MNHDMDVISLGKCPVFPDTTMAQIAHKVNNEWSNSPFCTDIMRLVLQYACNEVSLFDKIRKKMYVYNYIYQITGRITVYVLSKILTFDP